jgi:hypothetical protein
VLSCQREIGRHFASPDHCAPGTLMLTAMRDFRLKTDADI